MERPENLYQWLLSQQGAAAPARPARSSAAVVLWRRAGSSIEVFWAQRSPTMAFMGGWFAFPGGGVSKRDAAISVVGSPQGIGQGPQDGALPETVVEGQLPLPDVTSPALIAAALRELFEETGLLVAVDSAGRPANGLDRTQVREGVIARSVDFAQYLEEQELRLDASQLVYAGRWLTPPLAPMRFDNRFFLLEWPAEFNQQPEVDGHELVVGEWILADEALRRWRDEVLLTAPPIVHILKVLGGDGPDVGLERLRNPVEANLGGYRLVEFRPGVALFPVRSLTLPPVSHTNCYLLGHQECVVVDPAAANEQEAERLVQALAAADEKLGRRVTAVWLTHHHQDHTEGAVAVAKHFNVPIEGHPETVSRVKNRGITVVPSLEDGTRRVLAGERTMALEVLYTPGHAKGHIAIRGEDENWIVCGDLVAGAGTIVIDPPDGSMTEYFASLERLVALKPTVLFPGHGPVIRDGVAKLKEYVTHRRERELSVLEHLRNGVTDAAQIVKSIYHDVSESLHPVAERQVLAHLERLYELGRSARNKSPESGTSPVE